MQGNTQNIWHKIFAFIAFNVYALVLISAFQENTAYLFEASLIKEMQLSGFDVNPGEWGWGGHYIWRLFASAVVTAFVGFLAGAISKVKGSKIAAVANIPSVLLWGGTIYFLGFTGVKVEAQTGYIIISIIAIPLTTYIAYLSGGKGEMYQRQNFSKETVLGIKGYHWIWAIFPLYLYSIGIVYVVANYTGFIIETWVIADLLTGLLSLAMLIPILVWVYPLIIVHSILMGEMLSNKNTTIKIIVNFGILIGGIILASIIQFSIYWLLNKIF